MYLYQAVGVELKALSDAIVIHHRAMTDLIQIRPRIIETCICVQVEGLGGGGWVDCRWNVGTLVILLERHVLPLERSFLKSISIRPNVHVYCC